MSDICNYFRICEKVHPINAISVGNRKETCLDALSLHPMPMSRHQIAFHTPPTAEQGFKRHFPIKWTLSWYLQKKRSSYGFDCRYSCDDQDWFQRQP